MFNRIKTCLRINESTNDDGTIRRAPVPLPRGTVETGYSPPRNIFGDNAFTDYQAAPTVSRAYKAGKHSPTPDKKTEPWFCFVREVALRHIEAYKRTGIEA